MQASSVRMFCSSACRAAAKQVADKKKNAGINMLRQVENRKSQKARAKDGSDPLAAAILNQPNEDASTYLSPWFRPHFDLSQFNQILDIHPEAYSESSSGGVRIVHINTDSSPLFNIPPPEVLAQLKSSGSDGDSDPVRLLADDKSLQLDKRDLTNLHRYVLVVRRVVNMTSKGKIPSMSTVVVVGNGKGLVGYGEGKAENVTQAADRAFLQAVKNMDYVQRKDDRTIWSECMKAKWGATEVELRSRPPGTSMLFRRR